MFLHDEAKNPVARVMLAHGAGAAMDTAFMNDIAGMLAARGLSTARFEFDFMADRRRSGKRRPAPRGDKLIPEYEAAITALTRTTNDELPFFIGGKSLGGRVASLVADDMLKARLINGVVCLGYPFHPAKKPDNLRTTHLETLECPALIVQGTRDPLGSRGEVAGYDIDPRIELFWCEDGDHDLKPRKKSGFDHAAHLIAAADAIKAFVDRNCRL